MCRTCRIYGDRIKFAENQYDALENADALLIATEWNEFRTPDFSKMAAALKNKIIFDGRNLLDKHMLEKIGFIYYGTGK